MSGNQILEGLLIVGPTASGKTPLGDYLEQHGFRGRRCLHFDFGENLRRVAREGDRSGILSAKDMDTARRVVETGALLEDEEFHVACSILTAFVEARRLTADNLVILNGMPRHVGQARDIEPTVHVGTVISLECDEEVIAARIQNDPCGDRAVRSDDSPREVRKKLDIFRDRTLPLMDHYLVHGAEILRVEIAATTTPADIVPGLAGGG